MKVKEKRQDLHTFTGLLLLLLHSVQYECTKSVEIFLSFGKFCIARVLLGKANNYWNWRLWVMQTIVCG